MKALVAMSGGVDSSVSALLAKQAGYDVTGVHMALLRGNDRVSGGGCCTVEDMQDARQVSALIDIPFYVWDFSKEFQSAVVADFLREYKAGRTPNPCIRCNEFVKFNFLKDKASELGFDAIITGHYARNVYNEHTQTYELHRAKNIAKDQSYVLAVMGQKSLEHSIFPLGEIKTKDEVRHIALENGLPVSKKAESYDVCFIERGKTKEYLIDNLGARDGYVLSTSGQIIGTHKGAYLYTIGQRKGLDLKNPLGNGVPLYVVGKNIERNEITVGTKNDLNVTEIHCDQAIWYDNIDLTLPLYAQLRAHGEPQAVTITRNESAPNEFTCVTKDASFVGVATGQSLVLYSGDRVVGCGTIA
ncbi:MAG: tRNA 2-thiouridine(34) synthase MnmA [Bifidobacteriaceae bacterium]|jgi:tRNA-specific 2-thiouridylase|nr:tRNA 2-thiouridine(34) synthase MnmA [Bifidobacteriaceae bacterium]